MLGCMNYNNKYRWIALVICVLLVVIGLKLFIKSPVGGGVPISENRSDAREPDKDLLFRISNIDKELANMGVSHESKEAHVEGDTNHYVFSSNHVATRIVVPNPEFKNFGTPKFESLARSQFDDLTVNSKYLVDPNLYELKEVLEDFPLAKDSQYFFSGLYQVAVTTCTLQEIRELTFNTRYQAVRDLEEANRISDVGERDSKVQRIKDIAEAQLTLYSSIRQETLEDCRQNLTRLYGDLPKPIFQRLLSVELRKPMGRLPYP